jgi:PKD repeat protein
MKRLLLTLIVVPFLGMMQVNAQGCQADFVQDSSICPNVAFTDASTSNFPIVQWYWDFGDGTTSTSQNATHSYSMDGTFNVCLTTISSDSCVSTFCSTVNISCLGGGGAPCQASFTSVSFSDSLGGTVMYITNTSTVSPGMSYFWGFGDGNTSTDQYPIHSYLADGAYILCLTIGDSSCTSTYCDSIIVTGTQNGFTLVVEPAASANVENLELTSGVQLYPNPTNHNLTLNMESAETAEIEVSIVNVAGQVVGHSIHQIGAGSNEIKLYTEELMKGYYFIKINTSISNVEAIRFIKN